MVTNSVLVKEPAKNQLFQLCSLTWNSFDVFIETQSKLVLWHLKPLVKKVQNQFFELFENPGQGIYIHVPYHYPLVSGGSEKWELFSTYKLVEGFFNSQIHVWRCVFKHKQKAWSTLGLGGGARWCSKVWWPHHVPTWFSLTSLLYNHFNSLVYYVTSGRRKVTLRFSFH